MFSLLTLRRLLVALLVAIFAANVALFFERLRSGRVRRKNTKKAVSTN